MFKALYSFAKSWLSYSIEFDLKPLSSVSKNENGTWEWFGSDPQMTLKSRSNVEVKGFYMLEAHVENLKQSVNACLYTDQGVGYNEKDMYLFPMTRVSPGSKVVKRICYFENAVQSFRFDPSEEGGGCTDLSVKLVKLTHKKAKQLMLKKLGGELSQRIQSEDLESENDLELKDDLELEDDLESDNELSSEYLEYSTLFKKLNLKDYGSWIAKNETYSDLTQEQILALNEELSNKPLISIVCPTYNTKPEWLVACVESVQNQHYPHWELILVDDASPTQDHFDLLKQYESEDPKITVIYLEENGHISAATNAGIKPAKGDFITFLDHDDELAEHALYEICNVINKNPGAQIIYSDEDLMTEEGVRVVPHFKSDWNQELIRAHNYVTHLCVYDKALVDQVGGMRLGYEGAQDYDLILRTSSITPDEHIHHISKILYHWRMVEGSTALSSGAKSYTTTAGFNALTDYLKNNNLEAEVEYSDKDNFYTVKYALPAELPKVSIIIPTRDGMEVLRPCIESLIETTDYSNYEVVILDNGSEEDETLAFLEELSLKPNFNIVRDDGAFNYSRINNRAVEHSTGELVCLLNNDIEIIDANWLKEMVSISLRKEIGCVGAKLLYPDGTIQHAGVILGLGGYAAHSHRGIKGDDSGYFCRAQLRQQLSAVTGACLLIRREVYDEANGLDEAFQVAYNDVDFCLRVQSLGYQNIYTSFATLIHHESKTRGEDVSAEKIKRFESEKERLLERWSDTIENDPFYNINLTRASEDFSLRA